MALQHIPKTKHHSHIMFSDSVSSLQATDHPVALDIILRYNSLCSNNHAVIFCWIPGHRGIKDNFEADKATMSASTLPITQILLPASDFTPSIKHYISNLWQGLWNSYADNKLYQIRPTVNHTS